MIDKSKYNLLASYEIIGRVPNGNCIIGYILLDRRSNLVYMYQKDFVEQLALSKNIYNATAQIYKNNVHLKGINCKLSELPNYNADGTKVEDEEDSREKIVPKFKIVGRVQNKRCISAYILEYRTLDKEIVRKKVNKDETLNLARNGLIINAKAQLNSGILMLRGINEDLCALKTYKEQE